MASSCFASCSVPQWQRCRQASPAPLFPVSRPDMERPGSRNSAAWLRLSSSSLYYSKHFARNIFKGLAWPGLSLGLTWPVPAPGLGQGLAMTFLLKFPLASLLDWPNRLLRAGMGPPMRGQLTIFTGSVPEMAQSTASGTGLGHDSFLAHIHSENNSKPPMTT